MATEEIFHFATYDATTGAVLRVGSSSSAEVVSLERERLTDGVSLYEGEIDPETTYLPGGNPTPKQVAPRIVTELEVKAHAGRLLSYTDWVVVRALDTGEPADPAILAKRQAIRDASNVIEAMEPIPEDFTDPKYWPL